MTLIACTWGMQAQQTRTYHGTVLDASDNEPLVGATIMPIGGGQGVAANVDGKFTLTVPANVTKAHVSYVGYVTQEVELQDGMVVYMKVGSTKLDEMIVVAYGTAKKSAFTGSAAVVDASEIEKSQATNAVNALNGKVAGVQMSNLSGQPGSNNPTIYIRGISSINAGTAPLYVVNGTPYAGDMNNINPADIESITVLKDAASNALYGARGANGVILITTKKGKVGQKGTVTVDAKWGSNSRASQLYNTITDPRQYYELYYQYLYNFAVNNNGLGANAANEWANQNLTAGNTYGLAYLTYTVPQNQALIGKDGKFNPYATPGNLVTYNGQQYLLTPDNWLDEAYKTSLRQEYNISITKGTDGNQFYLSANYLNNEGITPKSGYERLTSRLTADSQISSWLKAGADLSYTHYNASYMSEEGTSNSSGNIFAAATQVAPIYPLYIRDAQGNIMTNADGILRYDYGDKENAGLTRPVYTSTNAISDAMLDTNKYSGNAFGGSAYAEIRFLKDFRFTTNNSVNYDNTVYTNITNPYYGTYSSSNGIINKETDAAISYTFQQLLNWEHTFGVNNIAILAGHENYWNITSVLYAGKTNMFDPNNDELNGAVTDGSMGSYRTKYNNEGWLFRAQYNYDEKYFASASFRRDASSRFAPENRWGNFWSAGAAWLINKESFMETATWIDLLKIKISYGEQGNDNIGNFRYINTYDIVNASGVPSAVPNTMGNRNITWEKNGNLNYGVEFDFFNGRLSGSVEGFWRKTSDMLSWFPLPPSYGWTGYYDNIGDMENKGVEIDLTGTLVQTKDITWTVNANFTWYKNKVSYLPEARKTMTTDGVDGYSSSNFFYGEGIPLYTYRMYKYAYPDPENGQALYWHRVMQKDPVTGNNVPTGELEAVPFGQLSSSNDYFLCGTSLPDAYGGFGTSITAYGFDFSIDFSYQIGGKKYDGMYASYMSSPTTTSRGDNFHKDLFNAWSPTNKDSNIPRVQFNDSYAAYTSDRFLTNASFLSLNNINAGYTFPSKWTRKFGVDKIRLYFAADNVWFTTKRKGLDTRQSITGGGNNTYYAPIRTLSGGINLTF